MAVEAEDRSIYDVSLEYIRGNLTPSVGRNSYYYITVINNYNSTLGGIGVELLCGETQLCGGYSDNLSPGTPQDIILIWTPQNTGVYEVHARITMNGDLNQDNNVSQTITLSVQPNEVKLGTIGGNTILGHLPFDFSARTSICDLLYRQAELNYSGLITQITFYNNFPQALEDQPVRLWMDITTAWTLSDWYPYDELTEVFNGTVDFPSGASMVTITLQQPFYLNPGCNLVLRSYRAWGLDYGDSYTFKGFEVPQIRGVGESYQHMVDPSNPEGYGHILARLPQTGFLFAPDGDGNQISTSPQAVDFSEVRMDFGQTKTLRIINTGSSPLSLTGIGFETPVNDFSLGLLPPLPVSLAPLEGMNVEISFFPQSEALQYAQICITADTDTCRVNISGRGLDPYLYSLPYEEDFDSVMIGDLPLDWSKIVQTTNANTCLVTEGHDVHSPPLAVLMDNAYDNNAVLILVAPPVAESIPINQLRLVFWLKGWYDCSLIIGVMEDPFDPASFVGIGSIERGYSWSQELFSLEAYTGEGHYIAFKFGGGSYAELILDDIRIEQIPAADLEAKSLSGEMLVSSMELNECHSLSVKNIGTQAQSAYTVRLFAGDQMVCEVPGVPLAPGQEETIPMYWTPPAGVEELDLSAVVAFPDDAFTDNNISDPFTVHIDSDQLYYLGESSGHYPIPFDTGYYYSLWETIIPASELEDNGGLQGLIERIWLYAYQQTQTIQEFYIYLWLGSTDREDLAEGWIPSGELDRVFSGYVSMMDYSFPLPIDFQTPFTYTGGNIVMMIYHPLWLAFTTSNHFETRTGDFLRSLYLRSQSTISPANPPLPDDTQFNGNIPRLIFAHQERGGIPGRLHLQVNDSGGMPVDAATARLRFSSYRTETDAQGQAELTSVLPGTWELKVSKEGYSAHTEEIIIAEDGDTYVSVLLSGSSANDPDNPEPGATRLLGASPNPFRSSTTICFELKEPGSAQIEIFNLRGQLVKRLGAERLQQGLNEISWDGRDASGRSTAPGIYLYKLQGDGVSLSGKLLRLN